MTTANKLGGAAQAVAIVPYTCTIWFVIVNNFHFQNFNKNAYIIKETNVLEKEGLSEIYTIKYWFLNHKYNLSKTVECVLRKCIKLALTSLITVNDLF